MQTDQFARETASHAHARITQTTKDLRKQIRTLERAISRRKTFENRCCLCGDPCKKTRRYCHAHAWAEGTD